MKTGISITLAFLFCALLSGCAQTSYKRVVTHTDGTKEELSVSRRVVFTKQDIKGLTIETDSNGIKTLKLDSSTLDPQAEAATAMGERLIGAAAKAMRP